jgi:hypothetical protein
MAVLAPSAALLVEGSTDNSRQTDKHIDTRKETPCRAPSQCASSTLALLVIWLLETPSKSCLTAVPHARIPHRPEQILVLYHPLPPGHACRPRPFCSLVPFAEWLLRPNCEKGVGDCRQRGMYLSLGTSSAANNEMLDAVLNHRGSCVLRMIVTSRPCDHQVGLIL